MYVCMCVGMSVDMWVCVAGCECGCVYVSVDVWVGVGVDCVCV